MDTTKSSHSPERQDLIREMQKVGFGRFEGLVIRNREPILHPRPVIVREHKFGGENGPRPEIDAADFLLKRKRTPEPWLVCG